MRSVSRVEYLEVIIISHYFMESDFRGLYVEKFYCILFNLTINESYFKLRLNFGNNK
jgi:hypothetical protein